VEHEKGDELLLARTRKARDRSAVDPGIEPAKQIDPERRCACHTSKITRECLFVSVLKITGTLASVEAKVSVFINPI
jgi:hypothetical protein